jgi:hypothetical protein
MDEEKPYHVPTADQHQPDDEAAAPDPADVVWDAWPEDAATMQVDVVAAAMDVGGADLLNFVDRAATENDEAIAHFVYMEQLREMEEENWEVRGFEEPRPAGAGGHLRRCRCRRPPAGQQREPSPYWRQRGRNGNHPAGTTERCTDIGKTGRARRRHVHTGRVRRYGGGGRAIRRLVRLNRPRRA